MLATTNHLGDWFLYTKPYYWMHCCGWNLMTISNISCKDPWFYTFNKEMCIIHLKVLAWTFILQNYFCFGLIKYVEHSCANEKMIHINIMYIILKRIKFHGCSNLDSCTWQHCYRCFTQHEFQLWMCKWSMNILAIVI